METASRGIDFELMIMKINDEIRKIKNELREAEKRGRERDRVFPCAGDCVKLKVVQNKKH